MVPGQLGSDEKGNNDRRGRKGREGIMSYLAGNIAHRAAALAAGAGDAG
jgi:hypothetical protein